MKALKMAAVAGAVSLLGLGAIMAGTNPDRNAYQEYGTQKLTGYVKDNVCQKLPLGKDQCGGLLESKQAEIEQVIAQNTYRQDFIFFSIYTTDLSLTSLVPAQLRSMVPTLPSYQFESVGVLQNFYTYKSQKTQPPDTSGK